jgi:hypothetical protein
MARRLASSPSWPELPLAPWRGTRDTLHLWTQIIGKTLLAGPAQNHWWHTGLRVSARGLASPPLVVGERSLEVELDLVDHALSVRSDERAIRAPLVPRPVRAFHEEYLELLRAVGADVPISRTPVELPDPIPFDEDEVHAEYDAAAAHRFWQVLRRCDAVFKELAASFLGKQSPVLFFWGSFDLAAARFSGRRAPERPGTDRMTREAFSHELVEFGFWPGGVLPNGTTVDEPIFFAFAAPPPDGLARATVAPAAARWDERLGEFVLPYAAVRAAADPAAAVRAFCESAYAAGAELGRWDRAALERR